MSEAVNAIADNLKAWQLAYIEIAMLLPTVITGVVFWYYGFPMVALLTILFFCYLIVPIGYIAYDKVCTHNVRIVSSFGNMVIDKSKQLKVGFLWFFISGGLMFGALWFTLTMLPYWQFHRINFFWYPRVEIITISVLMVLLDPFLEEFFWRLFVQSAFTGGITYSDPNELIIWVIALHYGLHYAFIFAVITQHLLYAFLAAIPFVIFSRKFSFVRSTGFLAAVIAHTGFNIGFVTILNLWFWNGWSIHGFERLTPAQ